MHTENVILYRPESKLGMAIRAARLQRGWSLQKTAQQLFMDQRTLDRIELGLVQSVSMGTIQDLARMLKSPRILRLGIEHIQRVVPELSPEEGQGSAS